MQLYTPIDIDHIQQDLPFLIEIKEWVKNFLAKPSPDLGRSGSVCPFIPHALNSNSIHLAVIRARNLEAQQVEEIVLRYRETFLELEPRDKEGAINKAILLIFPDIQLDDTSRLIDGVQQKLKAFFVEQGLMLGEFHNRTETPGLHNPEFRPLRSPIPLLAIRFMVESDLPFLQNTDDISLRIRYLEAFLKRFDNGERKHINLVNARQALALAQAQLKQETLLTSSGNTCSTSVSDRSEQMHSVVSCPFASRWMFNQ
ncbi:hypothetical protein G7B40_011290 [Aetokthonos hydrillicola Thurmond2011]|jgi:hypothetical protein|uniref:DUF6875 domain-containing protein n=1 Tax=Aetokthonos hydrillicola Thurmond2011 TaxID=2712845 RepID=A0AAP5M4T2_9CYAN|nr:hypothetical protein [Aetokthonos hydrillicola]MDR9895146.1 hypothetical protein [Aetokthonos hydrillicola Thurmond2011]